MQGFNCLQAGVWLQRLESEHNTKTQVNLAALASAIQKLAPVAQQLFLRLCSGGSIAGSELDVSCLSRLAALAPKLQSQVGLGLKDIAPKTCCTCWCNMYCFLHQYCLAPAWVVIK